MTLPHVSVKPVVLPWWKEPMCWLVLSGPLAVVIASLATAVVAWKHIDPLIQEDRAEAAQVAPTGPPTAPTAPALQGRNHAASPRQD